MNGSVHFHRCDRGGEPPYPPGCHGLVACWVAPCDATQPDRCVACIERVMLGQALGGSVARNRVG